MSEQGPSEKKRAGSAERAIGLIFILVAAFLAYSMRDLPFKPAMFPMALLAILAVLGLIVLLRPHAPEQSKSFRGPVNVVVGGVVVTLFVVSIDFIGFLYATILFFVVVLVASGFLSGHRYRYPLIILITVPIALVLSSVLVDVLKLPMP